MNSSYLFVFATLGLIALLIGINTNQTTSPSIPNRTSEEFSYLPPKGYVCYRTSKPITLDGKIDEEWSDVPWSDAFVDIEGARKPIPWYQTRMKMVWDEEALYIAAELEEPHVWGTLKQHDSVIFQDNDFEIFLDPDGDNFLYGELELNALNTTWDLLLPIPYKDGGRAVDAWEITGLRTAVHVDGTINQPDDTDRGWSVEIAWPWKGLKELTTRKIPPQEGDQWRINFSRVEWEHQIVNGQYRKVAGKKEENWVWSPQGVIDMHRPETWGYVQFTQQASGTTSFRPDPVGPVQQLLHQLYYKQKTYRKQTGKWATTRKELDLPGRMPPEFFDIRMQVSDSDFEICCPIRLSDGNQQVWRINSQSHFTRK